MRKATFVYSPQSAPGQQSSESETLTGKIHQIFLSANGYMKGLAEDLNGNMREVFANSIVFLEKSEEPLKPCMFFYAEQVPAGQPRNEPVKMAGYFYQFYQSAKQYMMALVEDSNGNVRAVFANTVSFPIAGTPVSHSGNVPDLSLSQQSEDLHAKNVKSTGTKK